MINYKCCCKKTDREIFEGINPEMEQIDPTCRVSHALKNAMHPKIHKQVEKCYQATGGARKPCGERNITGVKSRDSQESITLLQTQSEKLLFQVLVGMNTW